MNIRTIEYGATGGVRIIQGEVGDPGPGQVQIATRACGICAWDLFVFRHGGRWMPGHEGIGTISKVGPGVSGLTEGQRVVGHCLGFADAMNLDASKVYPIPADSTLPDEHWIVEPVACVVTGLDHCQLKPADRVAVIGCGFMGLLLVQGLAKSLCDRLVAIDIDDRRLNLAKEFGATETFNSKAPEFAERAKELKSWQFDTIVDASGAQAGLDLATTLVRRGGRINLFGWNHGQATFAGDTWHSGGFTIVNSSPSSALRDPWPAAIRLLHRGQLRLQPLVTHVVALNDYANLLSKAGDAKEGYIKGVVKN